MLGWFNAKEADRFAGELSAFVLKELSGAGALKDAKYRARLDKVLTRADRQVRDFKAAHPLNFYKKSRLANRFLWSLKDGGCAEDVAAELTDWLTLRL
ncbi:hypothetical protein [Ramlibacter sp.]|uniref:hypothetical protein n=1 Tax=Ramlibacter sp. TaxID=1917967 RepID=UPI003D09B022